MEKSCRLGGRSRSERRWDWLKKIFGEVDWLIYVDLSLIFDCHSGGNEGHCWKRVKFVADPSQVR